MASNPAVMPKVAPLPNIPSNPRPSDGGNNNNNKDKLLADLRRQVNNLLPPPPSTHLSLS